MSDINDLMSRANDVINKARVVRNVRVAISDSYHTESEDWASLNDAEEELVKAVDYLDAWNLNG